MIIMEIKKASTQKDFFGLVQLRTEVFVLEQKVDIQIEQDIKDFTAIHYIVWDNNEAVGCLRILDEEEYAVIGRVAVKKSRRKEKIGYALMKAIENDPFIKSKGKISLHAQRSAENFYIKCGYKIASEPYIEAGIEHVMMEKIL